MHTDAMEAIEALAQNEELLSRLYRAFSERYPESRDFWTKMAEEETQHANMIRTLALEVREGTVRFHAESLDATSLRMFRDYLRYMLTRCREEEFSLNAAFEAALRIEHDLIERNFFVVFETQTKELSLIFEGLASATREHRARLVKAMESKPNPR